MERSSSYWWHIFGWHDHKPTLLFCACHPLSLWLFSCFDASLSLWLFVNPPVDWTTTLKAAVLTTCCFSEFRADLILPPLTSPITVTSLAQTYILYCDSSLSSTDPWISLKANLYNAESSTAWTLTLYILIHTFFANLWMIISRNIHQWQWRSINLLNGTLKKVGSVVVWRCMIIGKI